MKLAIAGHARLTVPSALIPSEKPQEVESKKGLAERTKAATRRSLGIVSSASFVCTPAFLVFSEMVPFVASAGVLAASGLSMVLMRERKVRDFFPKFKEDEKQAEIPKDVEFAPYANWDNAFLPYAGNVVNIGYNPRGPLPKAALLGGACMEDFRVGVNITEAEGDKRRKLKNLYGEVTRTGGFWTSGRCDEAVRFYEE